MSRFSPGFIIPTDTPSRLRNLTFRSFNESAVASGPLYSFTTLAIGTAATDRWVFAIIYPSSSSLAITSVSIGGVTANVWKQSVAGDANGNVHIAGALVPTGTTCQIDVTYSGSQSKSVSLQVYTFNGNPSLVSADYQQTIVETARNYSTSLNLAAKKNGFVIANLSSALAAGSPANWLAASPAMTSDLVNTSWNAAASRMSTRSQRYTADATEAVGACDALVSANIQCWGISIVGA